MQLAYFYLKNTRKCPTKKQFILRLSVFFIVIVLMNYGVNILLRNIVGRNDYLQKQPSPTEIIKCVRKIEQLSLRTTRKRLDFVRAKRTFRCLESLTFATHADYSFLENLELLLKRW